MLHGFVSQDWAGFLAASNIFHSARHLLITNSILLTFISVFFLGHFLDLVIVSDKLVLDVLRCAWSISRWECIFEFDELLLVLILILLLILIQVYCLTS